MTQTSIDSEAVRALAGLLDETGLTEIEYETETLRIRVARQAAPLAFAHHGPAPSAPATAAAPVPAPVAAEDLAAHPGAVHSPMVGVVYLAPEPGLPPFVNLGDLVAEGQTLLQIEAMKTFNPIRAPRGGKIAKVLVGDGSPVEFGETLMVIE